MLLKNFALAKHIAADYETGEYSQQELAKKYGVSQQVISKWIRELKQYSN